MSETKYPINPVRDFRSTPLTSFMVGSPANGATRLCDRFMMCLIEGRKFVEKHKLEKDYILFIHATQKGGIAHSVDELYDDGFFADGVYYGFHFPFSPINEKVAEKIQKTLTTREKLS